VNAPAAQRIPVVAKPAATLVLVRPAEGKASGVEVLLMRRSSGADFVPGMYVFPGGGVDAADLGAPAAAACPHLTSEAAAQRLDGTDTPELALGLHVAALRETFEESGILLGKRLDASPARPTATQIEAGLRAAGADGSGFLQWLAQEGFSLAPEELIYFAHWITPKSVPKRFDTRFFLAEAPPGAQVRVDQAEIVGFQWTAPERAVEEHAAGRMPMIEPTLLSLEQLRGFASTAALRSAWQGRPVRAVLPKMRRLPDGGREIVYPWDPGYASEPEPL
jgi:8-oxo-dGTP pyrophosphatase MutT (NUDIX family)